MSSKSYHVLDQLNKLLKELNQSVYSKTYSKSFFVNKQLGKLHAENDNLYCMWRKYDISCFQK